MERAYPINAVKVRKLAYDRGWNVATLAKEAGVNEKSLRRWLQGERAFPSSIERLASALGVEARDFVIEERSVVIVDGTITSDIPDVKADKVRRTQELRATIEEALRVLVKLRGAIEDLGASDGSVRLHVRMSYSDARRLVARIERVQQHVERSRRRYISILMTYASVLLPPGDEPYQDDVLLAMSAILNITEIHFPATDSTKELFWQAGGDQRAAVTSETPT